MPVEIECIPIYVQSVENSSSKINKNELSDEVKKKAIKNEE